MNTNQANNEDDSTKNNGLLKLGLIVAGFIIIMIIIKYILDMVQK